MAKSSRGRRGIASRQCRPSPYPLPSHNHKNCSKPFKNDWEDATCPVCMEHPHNAVLLLCSSHEKGCRPYMCGTSFRYSNCLDQYKKAHSKPEEPSGTFRSPCPLCRGHVKGWTVVGPAREHLNAMRRGCMQEGCTFVGSFKELRKHVKGDHPSAKPREVDPTMELRWRRLERERERDDVMSTIRSSTPGAVFFGDYVIEGNNYSDESDSDEGEVDRNLMSVFLVLQAIGSSGMDRVGNNNNADEDSDDEAGRVGMGRAGRRRGRREVVEGGRR